MELFLFRSNNIYASRVNKYVNYYNEIGLDYKVYGWDRKAEYKDNEHYRFYKYKCGTAVGGFTAIINHMRWMFFVFNTLIKNHKEFSLVVHACDLNSAFPAVIFKKYFKKDTIVIFDVCDWFSANFSENKRLLKILSILERVAINNADEVIICEPERIEQIPFELKKKELVLPNIPAIGEDGIFVKNAKYQFKDDKLVISYFGGFSNSRFINEILDIAKERKINLLIAGYGDKCIEKKCIELNMLENVRYFGKLNPKDGLNMMYNSDIIYAMYCKIEKNNIYAAPNKFYESLFLGRPIISTKGIKMESKILNNNVGYVVEESVEDLKKLLYSIDREEMREKGRKARILWEGKYSTYVNDFFNNQYSKILN